MKKETTKDKPKTSDRPKETATNKTPPLLKPTPEPSGPDYKACYDHFHAKASEVAAAKRDWEAAADVAKTKKKKYETLQDELLEIGAGPPKTPLFEQDEAQAKDWRAIPIKDLKLKPKTVKALEKLNIETVGVLVDFQGKHGTFWVKEAKGVGVEAGTEIDNALVQVWKDNPQAATDVEMDIICKGSRPKALKAISEASARTLGKALKTGLKPDWRLVAVKNKIEALKALQQVEG